MTEVIGTVVMGDRLPGHFKDSGLTVNKVRYDHT